MVELLIQPPPPEAIARMVAIDGARIEPTVLATQEGPEGHRGPEAAGAVLILQATFADEAGAARLWLAAAELLETWRPRPGSSAGTPSPTARITR